MREIDLVFRTAFAELAQRSLDAQFQADFPVEGRFVTVPVKGREYWYFDLATPDGDKRRYVGPKADPEITARVDGFREIKDSLKARRRLVSMLTREGGMTAPDRFAGSIVETLGNAGIFRLRAVLIGTVAFHCYSGILGVRLPSSSMQTGDTDFAQDFAISAEVGDSLPPVLALLQSVDPSFRRVPHQADRARVSAFINSSGYRVEFLTGNRGSDDYLGKPSSMPALGGASADPLRFLDFLIYDPVRTVLLHKAGVSVVVPSPERYAVHKLIVASRRRVDFGGAFKRDKDILQASAICEAMQTTRRGDELAEVFTEAWNRGPHWQEAVRAGIRMMPKRGHEALMTCIGYDPGGERSPR
jgi:hypothetical protein